MKAKIHIMLKDGVLDPQGKAIENALTSIGFKGIEDVRQGKYIEVKLREKNREKAKKIVEKMCKSILSNPVIESFTIQIEE